MGDKKLLDPNMMKLMTGKLQNDVCWCSIRIANFIINCMSLKKMCYGGSRVITVVGRSVGLSVSNTVNCSERFMN